MFIVYVFVYIYVDAGAAEGAGHNTSTLFDLCLFVFYIISSTFLFYLSLHFDSSLCLLCHNNSTW